MGVVLQSCTLLCFYKHICKPVTSDPPPFDAGLGDLTGAFLGALDLLGPGLGAVGAGAGAAGAGARPLCLLDWIISSSFLRRLSASFEVIFSIAVTPEA